jgi:hypothetical protein
MAHEANFMLPVSIVSPSDLKRVKREMSDINDAMLQIKLRQAGEEQAKLPKTSRHLEDLVALNQLNLLHDSDRQHLTSMLDHFSQHSPVLHMSFNDEPSDKFKDRLITYLRQSFDPYLLVNFGLAPSIGAGCIVRTTNKYFDLSLKTALLSNKQLLINQLIAQPKPNQEGLVA